MDVIRQGLQKLKEGVDRESLRAQFKEAHERVKKSTSLEIEELDSLTMDALKDE